MVRVLALVSVVASSYACSFVSYMLAPSETKLTLENDNPLRSSMAGMQTLAIAHSEISHRRGHCRAYA